LSEIDLIREINRLREIVENLVEPEVGRWISWTPTLVQSVAVTFTLDHARYIALAQAVIMQVRLTATSAGVAGNNIIIGNIPSAISPINTPASAVGSGIINNAGTRRVGHVTATAVDFRMNADGFTGEIGTTPSFALANGDIIQFQATYER